MTNSYSMASLFSGIGGIDLAFQNQGFLVKWAIECDRKACDTYEANMTHRVFRQDIRRIRLLGSRGIDVLTAGFPCQAFSIAGLQKGFLDERGALFYEILRFIKDINPRIVFLENVKNLRSHDNGQTFNDILRELDDLGYYTKHKIMNTYHYSEIPQNRERIYILGFREEEDQRCFEFPKRATKRLQVTDLIEPLAPLKYYCIKMKEYPILKEAITQRDTLYQWRRSYVRENKSNVCPTLTANMGTGGHNVPLVLDTKGIRRLTPRECARFQGFPESFILPKHLSDSALYKQIGNSVSVPVVEAIAHQVRNLLKLNT